MAPAPGWHRDSYVYPARTEDCASRRARSALRSDTEPRDTTAFRPGAYYYGEPVDGH